MPTPVKGTLNMKSLVIAFLLVLSVYCVNSVNIKRWGTKRNEKNSTTISINTVAPPYQPFEKTILFPEVSLEY